MLLNEESVIWLAWKRRAIVFAILLAVLCLMLLPLWQKIGVQPTLLLILIYYWSIYRSDLLHVEQLVLISLILDGIYAYPLGFSALRLLMTYAILLNQKRILCHQRFHWVWCGFGVFVLLDGLIYAILLSFVKHEWTGIFPLIPGVILTIGLYPLVIWSLNRYVMKRLPA